MEAKKEAEEVRGKMKELEGNVTELEGKLTELQNRREIWQSKLADLRERTWENTRELEDPSEFPTEGDETANRLRILPEVSEEELRGSEKGKVERSILRLEAERESLRKNVNLSAIAE